MTADLGDRIVDVSNDLTDKQRETLGDKIEAIHIDRSQWFYPKEADLPSWSQGYHLGYMDALNSMWKLVLQTDDDYNFKSVLVEPLDRIPTIRAFHQRVLEGRDKAIRQQGEQILDMETTIDDLREHVESLENTLDENQSE